METSETKIEEYDRSTVEQRAHLVQERFDMMDGARPNAILNDFNMCELEIDFIIENIRANGTSSFPKILDLGCGNGYTDLRIAEEVNAEIMGVDFSKEMISGAQYLMETDFAGRLHTRPTFVLGDIREINIAQKYYDFVITQRCHQTLPDIETQHHVINKIHNLLKPGGIYIMVEGTRDGLRRLNEMRTSLGLQPIPDRAEDNFFCLKFKETEIDKYLEGDFRILKKQHFGMYYLISRVVHPLLVYPEQPKWDAKINEVARNIARRMPDCNQIGQTAGWVLQAK